jgi:hypothetical protein
MNYLTAAAKAGVSILRSFSPHQKHGCASRPVLAVCLSIPIGAAPHSNLILQRQHGRCREFCV